MTTTGYVPQFAFGGPFLSAIAITSDPLISRGQKQNSLSSVSQHDATTAMVSPSFGNLTIYGFGILHRQSSWGGCQKVAPTSFTHHALFEPDQGWECCCKSQANDFQQKFNVLKQWEGEQRGPVFCYNHTKPTDNKEKKGKKWELKENCLFQFNFTNNKEKGNECGKENNLPLSETNPTPSIYAALTIVLW